ncbi:erythronate-4-phosphate dehydrogenase [Bacteroidia bacterium]|nr:erythronate-4-phosphate dehydrogenase [Bacteroidia bacterium]
MERLKIVADDKIPYLWGVLEPYADIIYLPGSKITAGDVKDADALFTRTRTKCGAALLQGSNVKLIATATIGFDHIDTAFCEANGIRWVNAPGCNSSSVQQYITTALLTLAKEQDWKLREKTLGIIGVGNVGRKVATAARALGMCVLLNDPPRAEKEGAGRFTPLDELLAQSDIVTCHTPLTKDGPYPTRHLANDSFFEQMKDGAVFINTSRGAVADSEALKRAAGTKLSAFILDVWEGEPDIDPVLLKEAYIATPHIAGYSADGKANGTAACIQELVSFFNLGFLSKRWHPEAIPQPPFPKYHYVDCESKGLQELAYHFMTHAYPIWEDSQRLKESPQLFEQLRGGYWIRREPSYYVPGLDHLVCGDRVKGIVKKFKKLGFTRMIINRELEWKI